MKQTYVEKVGHCFFFRNLIIHKKCGNKQSCNELICYSIKITWQTEIRVHTMDGLTSGPRDIQVSTAASHFHFPDHQWNERFDSSYCNMHFAICSTDNYCDCKYDR